MGVGPESIVIDGLFYYKKRARSSRLNPVRLRTTTDGFRAVAEHPTGEVPLGVMWTQKYTQHPAGPKLIIKVEPGTDQAERKSPVETSRKSASPSVFPHRKLDENEIPEKRRKIDSPSLKTNVPDAEEETERRYPYKSQYQWPDNTSVEVLLNYDGITERKALVPGLAFVVQSLLKGNFGVLSREVAASLILTKNQEALIDTYRASPKSQTQDYAREATSRGPIKYLKDAKLEIFKILSLLNLSKSRFQQLLDWMKTLKLEEGKQGRFFLSERNELGRGLQVAYDTNEEAAMKLNQIYKQKAHNTASKTLHPITETFQTSLQAQTNSQTAGEQGHRVMFLLPHTNTIVDTVPKSSSALGEHLKNSQVLDVQSGISLPSVSTSQPKQTEQEDSVNRTNSGHALPSILRRKQRHPVHIRERTSSPNPTPMHLYKAHQGDRNPESDVDIEGEHSDTGEQTESAESDSNPVLVVKQEPLDYNSDATYEYEEPAAKPLSPAAGMFEDSSKKYQDVLKSDAQMPQSSEQNDKPFHVMVKSEPLDDYE